MSKLITSKTLDASKLTPLGRKSTKPSPIRASTKPTQKIISKQASSKAFDSKTSTIDKSQRTDSSPWQTFQKLSTNLITESMLCGNLISEDNSLDFSSFNLYSSNVPKEHFKVFFILLFLYFLFLKTFSSSFSFSLVMYFGRIFGNVKI